MTATLHSPLQEKKKKNNKNLLPLLNPSLTLEIKALYWALL